MVVEALEQFLDVHQYMRPHKLKLYLLLSSTKTRSRLVKKVQTQSISYFPGITIVITVIK
jgi:hypothetical protein